MSHHVIVTLPDGRAVRVDYRTPVIVKILERINDQLQKPVDRRDYDKLAKLDLTAAAWLDENPGLNCTWDQMRDGTCTSHDLFYPFSRSWFN